MGDLAQPLGDTALASVDLQWSVAGGAVTTVPMTNVAGLVYHAEIPAQPVGTEVEYAVEVADAAGRTVRSRAITFRAGDVAEVPGCGQFSLPSLRTMSGRALVVLGNVLLLLLAVAGARRIAASRHHHSDVVVKR